MIAVTERLMSSSRSDDVSLVSVARGRKAKEGGVWICVLQFIVTQDHVQPILAASSSLNQRSCKHPNVMEVV
jgi:hypothetical protein